MNLDPSLLIQIFFGVFVLGGAWAAACAYFLRPIAHTLDRKGRISIGLVALTMCGGGIGAFGWFLDDPRSFSWDLPPLASRFLAAAGWAFAGLAFLALRRPTWPRVSLVLQALLVYLAPIGIAALVFHRERFDARAPITYAFFAVVLGMCVAALALLASPSRTLVARGESSGRARVGTWDRIQLAGTAALLLPWSVALFVEDSGPTRLVWVWPGDLLSSRLIAVMLLTVGVNALASLNSPPRARMSFAFQIVYGLGVLAAGAMNAWNGKPVPVAYLSAFGAILLTSAAVLARSSGRSASA